MDIQDLTQLPNTRQEAIELGSKYYFTGKACKHGHIDKINTNNSTCYSCAAIMSKNWRDSHKERMCELVRKSKKKFRERDRNSLQNWRKNNPDSVRIHNAHYLSRKKDAVGFYKKEHIEKIMLKQNFKCNACCVDVSKKYHVDHIIPLSRSGSNYPDNLQILCPSCNCSKGAKTHDEFIEFLQKQKSALATV